MHYSKNKIATIAIAIFLTISIVASTSFLQVTSAHTPAWLIPTFAYVQAVPNPVGVGETTHIYMWINRLIDGTSLLNNVRFHNYQLTITAPDGTQSSVKFDIVRDSTSNQGYSFTPTQTGTYMLNFTFPGQKYTDYDYVATSQFVNDTYLASNASTTLTVSETPAGSYPPIPLPEQYWTRPIYGMNTDWWSISSNWLGNGAPGYQGFGSSPNLGGNLEMVFPGDAVGPLTGHIMWTKPLQAGGVVGGNKFIIQGATNFEGSAYQQRFSNPIIINGILYYTDPISFSGPNSGPTKAVNLRTGEVMWSRTDVPALSFGYIYDVQDPNQHGTYPPILFTSNFARAFDAWTGNALFNLTNVPSGTAILGVNGEVLRYVFTNYGTTANPNWYLAQWNSSNLWTGQYSGQSTSPSVIPPITNASDPRMFDWNISIPYRNTAGSATAVQAVLNDVLLMYNGTLPSTGATFMGSVSSTPYTYFAINLNSAKGAVGSILWSKTYDPPPQNITVLEEGIDPVNRVFMENYRETNNWVGFNLDTGAKIWGPTPSQAALDYYGSQGSGSLAGAIAYGRLYSSALAGILYCYDTKTGNLLWTYGNGGTGNSTNSGYEVPGNYPTFVSAIGNGVVYTVTSEHTPETPIYKGALVRGINATDGTEIWTLSAYTGEFVSMSEAIADGYATFFNGYDNQVYVVGRGPSATTVEAPKTSIELGKSLVIEGTVTDIAAGTKQDQPAANFPNGVPVASDASMREWMGYVYQQQPMPTNFTGVDVTVDVYDANGNFRNIGTVKTDSSGTYSLAWKPDIPGKYLAVATFHGTNGYFPSYSETSFVVDTVTTPAPTAPPVTGYATTTDLAMYIIAAVIALIIAIAIVGLLILRKHP